MKKPKTKKGALKLLDEVMKDVEVNVCPSSVWFINRRLKALRKAIKENECKEARYES